MEPNQFAILVQSEVENWTALVRYATRQKTISAREPPFGARNLNLMQMIGILKHPFFDLGQIVDFGSGKIYHCRLRSAELLSFYFGERQAITIGLIEPVGEESPPTSTHKENWR